MTAFMETHVNNNTKEGGNREYILPTIEVVIHNKLKQEALIDTGSSVNIISQDLLNKLKAIYSRVQVKECEIQCRTASKTKMEILGQCVLKVKISKFTWKVLFLVSKTLSYPIILGSEFIHKSGMVVDLLNSQCYFNFKPSVKVGLIHSLAHVKINVNNVIKEINIGCSEVTDKIQGLIKKYKDVFTNRIGSGIDYEYTIKVTDPKPVNIRPYPVNPAKMKVLKGILDDLLKQDIIRPSQSPYNSPAFLVPKGQDKYRLVVNYSEVNKKIERVNTPLGDLHEMYHYLEGAKYFTVLDLCSSFHQIRLSEECKHITSFSTPYESYEFNRIPFGIHLGSSLLSSYLNKVLEGIKFKFTLNYVDDIIIYSRTLEEHMEHLEEVTKRLNQWNLTVNPEKVKFVFKEIQFLGYLISHNQIKIDPERTSAILNAQPPTNAKGVSRFIGMASYFAKFIPKYAEIAAPINELRKKGVKFIWSEKCQENFNKIKTIISNPPVLKIPNYNEEFILHTDASNNAIGACLLQREKGELKPVAFYSKKLNQSEKVMSIYHKECLAVTASIQKFYSYLEVQPFILRCDNSALAWILTHCRKLGKLARWCEIILSLPFKVERIKGTDNVLADYLSRMFANNEEEVPSEQVLNQCFDEQLLQGMNECHVVCNSPTISADNEDKGHMINNITDFPMSCTQLGVIQRRDPDIIKIIESIDNKTNSDKYYLKNNTLMYKYNDRSKERIYLPEEVVKMVFEYYHNSTYGGHPGSANTFRKINQYFYRPNLQETINNLVKNCDLCKKCKAPNQYLKGPLISSHSTQPMEKLYIDIFGPLTRSSKQNKYLLIVVDDFTKFNWLFPMKEIKSKKIIELLNDRIFSTFSLPRIIISDNAGYFMAQELKQFFFKKGITHKTTIPYQPQGNKSERYLRNLKAILKIYAHKQQNKWDAELSELNLAINNNACESTGFSAFELMFTHVKNDPLTNKWNLNELVESKLSEADRLQQFQKAVDNMRRGREKNARRYPATTGVDPRMEPGGTVYIRVRAQSNLPQGFQEKLHLIYDGPYKILAQLSDVSLLVQSVKNPRDVRRVHIKDVKI